MSIVPLGDKVVAQRAVEEEVTDSGIILPDSVVKEQDEATVIALGPFVYEMQEDCIAIGDTIVLERHCGQKVIDTDGTEYVVVGEEDIIAIIRG